MKNIIYIILLTFFTACQSKTNKNDQPKDTLKFEKGNKRASNKNYQISFQDSTRYRPDSNIILTVNADLNNNVTITLYHRNNNKLILLQKIDNLKSQFRNTTPTFEDLNNDGINDLKLQFGTGARGSNEFFYAFLQDKNTCKLTYIKESSEIPNIQYDTNRNVITGIYYYAGTTFQDFKLSDNKLIKLGGVDVFANEEWTFREYYNFDNSGNRILIRKDSIQDAGESLYSR